MSKKQSISTNNPSEFDISRNSYQSEFFNFIEEKIELFPAYLSVSIEFQNLPDNIEGENKLTEQLHRFLTSQERNYDYKIVFKEDFYNFIIENQTSGQGHRSYDISIILGKLTYNAGKIVVIEAKRLPTRGTAREKEYLFGNLGAVERFRKEVHGQDVKSNKAIILGYIQSENSSFWLEKVNAWIEEESKEIKNRESTISWTERDKLKVDNSFSKQKVKKLKSIHNRIKLPKIELIHYWIEIN